MTSVKSKSDQIESAPIDGADTVHNMRHLPREQVEHARSLMKEALKVRFGGNKSKMSRAMGVSQPTITGIANGTGGIAIKTIETFAKIIGATPEEVRGLPKLPIPFLSDVEVPDVISADEGLYRVVVVAMVDLQLPPDAIKEVVGRFERRKVPMTPMILMKALIAESEIWSSGGLPGTAISSENSNESLPEWDPKRLR